MKKRPSKQRQRQDHRLPAARTSRQLAFTLVERFVTSGEFVSQQLDAPGYSRFTPQDRALAMEIASGVIRRRATLQALLAKCVTRERSNIEDRLWRLLEIGCYQLMFNDGVADHAAIHETVELCRWLKQNRWAGFLNGVLRAVQRLRTDELSTDPAVDAVAMPSGSFRQLAEDVFPDPATNPVEFLSAQFSLPRWMIRRWRDRFSFDELCEIGFWYLVPGPITLRVNQLKTSREEYLQQLLDSEIQAEAGQHPQAIALRERVPIVTLPGYLDGVFSVQDETAMQVGTLLDPKSGESILDLCAAPGTKTCHIAEMLNGQGTVVACDVREHRLEKVEENATRLGLGNVETQLIQEDGQGIPAGPFDAALVDAPCSNTGVLGKRPEARWRVSESDLVEFQQLQKQLLNHAIKHVRSGGRIVYSTCSIESDENMAVVQAVCDSDESLTIESVQEMVPGKPADGGFAALIRKA